MSSGVSSVRWDGATVARIPSYGHHIRFDIKIIAIIIVIMGTISKGNDNDEMIVLDIVSDDVEM